MKARRKRRSGPCSIPRRSRLPAGMAGTSMVFEREVWSILGTCGNDVQTDLLTGPDCSAPPIIKASANNRLYLWELRAQRSAYGTKRTFSGRNDWTAVQSIVLATHCRQIEKLAGLHWGLDGPSKVNLKGNVDMDSSQEATDKAMMARCIELSRIAVSKGEYPFGTVIALDGQVVAEAINSTVRDGDVTRHAEVIALSAGAEDNRPEAAFPLHALYQYRAVRDVLLLHSRGPGRPGGLCPRLSGHGRPVEMEYFA